MKRDAEQELLSAAADLFARRGVNGAPLREIIRQSQTPRGSFSHYFPGGKAELVERTLLTIGDRVSNRLRNQVEHFGVLTTFHDEIERWRQKLVQKQFEAGSAVLAIAAGEYLGENGVPNGKVQRDLQTSANWALGSWSHAFQEGLRRKGLSPVRSRRIANTVIAAVEGAVVYCRVSRSTKPLDDIAVELESLLVAALESAKHNRFFQLDT